MKACASCGARVEDSGARRCPGCGASIAPPPMAPSSGASRSATHASTVVQELVVGNGHLPLSAVLDDETLLVLAIDRDERVTIHRFTLDGARLGTLGPLEPGTGDGEIGEPAGIALDDAKNIYLLDEDGCRVVKLDGAGRYLRSFGARGLGPSCLRDPRDLEVTRDGEMLLADTRNNRVLRWTRDGTPSLVLGPEVDEDEDTEIASGSAPGQFDAPAGVTADARGRIYVADTNNHRIQVFDADGAFLRAFGREGEGVGEIKFPTDVRVDGRGAIFVFDLDGRRLQKYSPAGDLVFGVFVSPVGLGGVSRVVGDIDVGADESFYIPVPADGVVLRVRRSENEP